MLALQLKDSRKKKKKKTLANFSFTNVFIFFCVRIYCDFFHIENYLHIHLPQSYQASKSYSICFTWPYPIGSLSDLFVSPGPIFVLTTPFIWLLYVILCKLESSHLPPLPSYSATPTPTSLAPGTTVQDECAFVFAFKYLFYAIHNKALLADW